MSDFRAFFEAWLLHSTLGGGLLLLLAWGLMRRCTQPARRQRLGEWGVAAALLLAVLCFAPPWLNLPVLAPAVEESACTWEAESTAVLPPSLSAEEEYGPDEAVITLQGTDDARTATTGLASARLPLYIHGDVPAPFPPSAVPAPKPAQTPAPAETWLTLRTFGAWLAGAYAVVALYFFGRWLLGHIALRRLLRDARLAPRHVADLFDAMSRGERRPRLLISDRLSVPISCGLLRPAVLVPASLCAPGQEARLRWVFAHELTHLERQDAWSCWLFGAGQVLYFVLPWFWWLRRQVRLCQEYVADAAAAAHSDCAADYAQFLLSLTQVPAVSLPATGVVGDSSDLFRRVTMLLQDPVPVEKRVPRWWSFAAGGGLVALAVLVSGVGLRAAPVVMPEDDKKEEKKVIRARVVSPDDGKKEEKRTIILEIVDDDDKKADRKNEVTKKREAIRTRVVTPEDVKGAKPHFIVIGDDGDEKKPAKKGEVKVWGSFNVDEILKNLPEGVDKDKVRKALEQAQKGLQDKLKNLPDGADGEVIRKRIQEKLKDLPEIDHEGIRKKIEARLKEMPQVDAEKFTKDAQKWKEMAEKFAKDGEKWKIMAEKMAKDGQQFQFKKDGQPFQFKFDQPSGEFKLTPSGEAPSHGRLGVMVSTPSAALADQLDLPKGQGLVVEQVTPGSAAAKAGLKVNDVLLEVNGKAIKNDAAGLVKMIESAKAVELTILRKGKKETVKVSALGETKGEKRTYTVETEPAKPGKGAVTVTPKVKVAPAQPAKPAGEPSGGNVTVTVTRNDDHLTARRQEGSLTITVTGDVEDGKTKIGGITVRDGRETHKYGNVGEVPEQYREKVKKLLEMSGQGGVKYEIRKDKKETQEDEKPKRKKTVRDGGDA